MALFKSSNPILDEEKLYNSSKGVSYGEGRMTVEGGINKSYVLLGLLLATGFVSFMFPSKLFLFGGLIGSLVAVIWAAFQPQKSAFLAPMYAVFDGLFLGTITFAYGARFEGIVFNAIVSTLGIFLAMLFIYKSNIIPVTNKLRTGIFMATAGIALLYLVNFVMSLFGMPMGFLHDSSPMSIGISLLVIGVASFNLLLDFDNFEQGARFGAPKYMEWYCAMGLLVTLVWLYLEILRLLAKLSSRD